MKVRFILGVALGAFFLYLSLRRVDLQETWETIRHARYSFFLLFLAVNLLFIWVRAVRWHFLLLPVRSVRSTRLLSPMCIGLLANFIFPARAGEFIRAYLLGKRESISKSSCFATVVVERLFDGLAIITFLGLAPLFFQSMEGASARRIQWAGIGVFVIYLTILGVLLVLSHHREALSRFLGNSRLARRSRLLGKLFEVVDRFAEGLAVLQSTGAAIKALALSFLVWIAAAFLNYLMMHAVGITLPLYAAFLLVVVQSFGVMVPSPGFVGSYQYAHIIGLSLYGVPESKALSLAILLHAGYFLLFLGLGLFFLGREHLSWRELETVSADSGTD